MSDFENRFVWYELLTSDARAAEAFYAAVIGWHVADVGQPGTAYTLACAGEHRVAGIMTLPQEVCDQGGRPGWLGYVAVADVDAKAREAQALGGAVLRQADDIPNVGRFAVIADPQGAVLVLYRPFLSRRSHPRWQAHRASPAGTSIGPPPSPSTGPCSAGRRARPSISARWAPTSSSATAPSRSAA